MMTMTISKRILVLLVVIIFTLGVIGLAFSAETITGKVTKIEGNKVTVKTDDKEVTVEVKSTSNCKVGDTVTIKDGELKKKKVIEGC